ncbi:hypothetical protein JN10_2180 [Altererythrobacter ishigakiensis]|uniref:Uncharacterized protein n=1 Tax=Altererythrobacter ishigakiensis TaxID=476157 RepID=A0A562ULZ5_9SPHN|nr:hypothetical protein JN10_2180 [Altererythrobacter ishigakiensis]
MQTGVLEKEPDRMTALVREELVTAALYVSDRVDQCDGIISYPLQHIPLDLLGKGSIGVCTESQP